MFNAEGRMSHLGRHPRRSGELHTWLLSRGEGCETPLLRGIFGNATTMTTHRPPQVRPSPQSRWGRGYGILAKHTLELFSSNERDLLSETQCYFETRLTGLRAAHSDWEGTETPRGSCFSPRNICGWEGCFCLSFQNYSDNDNYYDNCFTNC